MRESQDHFLPIKLPITLSIGYLDILPASLKDTQGLLKFRDGQVGWNRSEVFLLFDEPGESLR